MNHHRMDDVRPSIRIRSDLNEYGIHMLFLKYGFTTRLSRPSSPQLEQHSRALPASVAPTSHTSARDTRMPRDARSPKLRPAPPVAMPAPEAPCAPSLTPPPGFTCKPMVLRVPAALWQAPVPSLFRPVVAPMRYAPAAHEHFPTAPFPHYMGPPPLPRDIGRSLAARSGPAPLFGATGRYGHTGHIPAWPPGPRMRAEAPEFHPRPVRLAYHDVTPAPACASPPLWVRDSARGLHAAQLLRDGSNSSRSYRVGPSHPTSLRVQDPRHLRLTTPTHVPLSPAVSLAAPRLFRATRGVRLTH